jgi:hypothetical protein
MKYYGIQNEVKAYINRLQDENGIFVSTSDIKTINDRVESLKRSGVWSRFSLGFNDVDGDAYLARAGVTNPLGRCEVLWFVRGMKALDLWRSMVCWSLRNYQNAGAGSTVYSLGGLGVHNGTLVNAVSWSSLGIFWSVNNSYLNVPSLKLSNVPCTVVTVDNSNTSGYTSNGVVGHNTNNGKIFFFPGGNREYLAWRTQALNFGSFTSSTFKSVIMSVNSISSARGYYNKTPKSVSNASFDWNGGVTTVDFRYTYNSTNNQTWNLPFLLHANIDIYDKGIQFTDLYKSTLGNGLGLP